MESDALIGQDRRRLLYAWRNVRAEAHAIWGMAWKISLASFCRLSVFTISTAFLGQLGTRELAASALAQSVIGALRIVTWASSTSLSTLCGQAYGARNFELVGTWLQMGLVVLSVASIPLVAAHFYAYLVLQYVVPDDPELLALAQTFANYTALSVWPNAIYVALRCDLTKSPFILFNVWGLAYGVYLGFSTPIQVRVSHALGANDPLKAKQVTVVGFALGSLATLLVVIVPLAGRRWLVGVFTQDPALQDILGAVLPIFCMAASISGLHVMLSSVLEAMSLAMTLVVVSGVGSWAILLPVSYYFGISQALGLAGLWWGSVVGEGAKFVLTAIVLFGLYDWTTIAQRISAEAQGDVVVVDEEVEALTSADTMKSPVAAATNSSF
ncbi:hypothetical protein B5M09_004025 [Aphanomyces astaci]|uniref:Polysaccharide biosynthesis protein C-terminal domain-containing protein n=1 Tax=Aphanomyces astaci TaxID=112090 RepID=A0A425BYF5_APHAT|nr:hypothetical protein B5M09_004025 [Aphanomyces astaci]